MSSVLDGLRVLDLSHQYSGALAGSLLADLGAEVITVEHPTKSSIRTMLPRKSGESIWWKVIQRNKRAISLDLSKERGQDVLKDLSMHCDVLIENFRPGTMERWNIGPSDLESAGASLVYLRISGFGQTGPYRDRPGFGTIAEAISGFAHLNGFPEHPPVFPSTTLADGVAAVFGAFGIMSLLWSRAADTGDSHTEGVEVVDVALFEALFRLIPTQATVYDQTGEIPKRPGNKLTSHGVLRNLYVSKDGTYYCVSAVGLPSIRRIIEAAGAGDLVTELDGGALQESTDRVVDFLDRCDAHMQQWSGRHDYHEISEQLDKSGAVYQAIYSVEDIFEDPHYWERNDLVSVKDSVLGSIVMQGVVPKFPGHEHDLLHAGRARGLDNRDIYCNLLGIEEAEMRRLESEDVV